MSIDWNWGIFLQPAPFGGTTYLGWIWSGMQVTVALSLAAWVIAFLLGSLLGILRTLPSRPLAMIGAIYVELFRNVPLIVQFFTWYLVVPELLPADWGNWFKGELDPSIQFFAPRCCAWDCLPPPGSASRCAPPFSLCRPGRGMLDWPWASPCRRPTAMSCCPTPIG